VNRRTGTSLWRLPAIRQLVVLTLLGFASFFLTLASLPSWAVAGDTSPGSAGLVTAVMMTSTVLVQAAVPALVTRLGVARVLALGLLLLGAPAPFYLLSQELAWLLVVSAVRGCGFAVLTVLGAAIAERVAPPSRHGEAVGVYGLAIAAPSLLAVPAGAALTLSGRFGWVAVLAAAPVLALPLVRRLARTGAGHDGARAVTAPGPARAAISAVASPSIVLLAVTLAGSGLVTFLPIERPDGSLASAALLVFGVTGALSRWRAGVLADRFGSRLLFPFSLCAAATGLLGIASGLLSGASALEAVLVVVGAAVFGAGYGAVLNLSLLLAFARAGRDSATTASAVWNASFDIGLGIGALAVGTVASAGLGLPWTYIGCVALIVITVPLAVSAAPGRRAAAADQ
jgi:predicted MFS family arabinose efflux permease